MMYWGCLDLKIFAHIVMETEESHHVLYARVSGKPVVSSKGLGIIPQTAVQVPVHILKLS